MAGDRNCSSAGKGTGLGKRDELPGDPEDGEAATVAGERNICGASGYRRGFKEGRTVTKERLGLSIVEGEMVSGSMRGVGGAAG